jgi:uncharacterized protein YifE (UPF0438 family)
MPDPDNSCELSAEEEALLHRHMTFYRSLETGQRRPATEAQEHFARVTHGLAAAETIHELAYVKHMRLRAIQRELERQNQERECEEAPSPEWFSREDWYKLRGRQRNDIWHD